VSALLDLSVEEALDDGAEFLAVCGTGSLR
jgi:hypothetical protein